MGPIGLSLVGAGLDMAGSLFGQGLSYKKQKKLMAQQFDYQNQLMATQNKYNVDNWKMQTEYNSPENQRARLEDAGLNVGMLYGGGQIANTAGQIQGTSLGSTSIPSDVPMNLQLGSALLALRKQQADINYIEAQTNNVEGLTELQEYEKRLKNSVIELNATKNISEQTKNALSAFELEFKNLSKQDSLQQIRNTANLGLQSLDKLILETQKLQNENPLSMQLLQAQIDNVIESTIVAKVKERFIESGINLNSARIADLVAGLGVKSAQISNLESSTDLMKTRDQYTKSLDSYIIRRRANETVNTYVNAVSKVVETALPIGKIAKMIKGGKGSSSGSGRSAFDDLDFSDWLE